MVVINKKIVASPKTCQMVLDMLEVNYSQSTKSQRESYRRMIEFVRDNGVAYPRKRQELKGSIQK